MRLVVFAKFFFALVTFAKSTGFASCSHCSGAPVKHLEREGKTWTVIGEAFCFPAFQQANGICPSSWRLDVGNKCPSQLCDCSCVCWSEVENPC